MPHVLEPAPSGRAKCRGCGGPIAQGELRFGERLPNPFADGEMTLWFHLLCAACKRPAPLLEALAAATVDVPGRPHLEHRARLGVARRRLPRIDGAERAPSARAACRHCKQPIARGAWRIRLGYFEDGRFAPGGFVHLDCGKDYFECGDLLAPLLQFSGDLDDVARDELRRAYAGA